MLFSLPTANGWLVIPSHSDVLDLAANGGLLALGILVCWPFFKALGVFVRTMFGGASPDQVQLITAGLFMSSLLLASANPILHQPQLAIFL